MFHRSGIFWPLSLCLAYDKWLRNALVSLATVRYAGEDLSGFNSQGQDMIKLQR